MNTIKFIPVKKKELLQKELKKELEKVFFRDEKIAVKVHMGEEGNKFYLKPNVIKEVVKILLDLGVKPFLFDSPVTYKGERDSAEKYLSLSKKHGFSEKYIGCPVVISNESIAEKTKHLDVGVCKELVDADGVLVVSHVKGHLCCGFGGAIKNLGMGALSKKTKNYIHTGGEPQYIGDCNLCGECAKACPLDNIRYDKRPYFDKNKCCGCSNCVIVCKFNALKTKNYFFDALLAEGASAALRNFKKSYFLSFIIDIAKTCDCHPRAEHSGLKDIGILMGKNIVVIDKASIDLINKKAGKDFFKEIHHKSPLVHIKEAEKLGMGNEDYKLEEL